MIAHGGLLGIEDGCLPSAPLRRFEAAMPVHKNARRCVYRVNPICTIASSFYSTFDPTNDPLFVSAQGDCVTLDGRIDNRGELLKQTGGRSSISDSELFCRMYAKQGTGCFASIIGDWAVAIYSRDARTLLLAKDYAGTRPLDYCFHGGIAAWSSELGALLAFLEISPKLDEEYLLRFMQSHPPPDRTPFERIGTVAPGHFTRISSRGLITAPYYELKVHDAGFAMSDADYEAEFRNLFRESVQCRMNPRGENWAELSGGLDSTSIVCQAGRCLSEGPADAGSLRTLSYVFRNSTSTNEDHFIAVAENALKDRIVPIHLGEDDFDLFATAPEAPFIPRPQAGPGRAIAVGKILAQHNPAVLLSGQGGDAVMWSESRPFLPLADQLRAGKLRGLFRSALKQSICVRTTVWDILFFDVFRPAFLPRRESAAMQRPLETWFRREPFQRLREGRKIVSRENRDLLPGDREGLRRVEFMIRVLGLHYFRSCGPIPVSYPYLDRRLVEFMLRTPSAQKLRANETRSLHRRALRNLLPEAIAMRQTKAEGGGAVVAALNRTVPAIKEWFGSSCRLAALGYIDLPTFRKTTEAIARGHDNNVFSFMRAISLEGWLRSLERWRPSKPGT